MTDTYMDYDTITETYDCGCTIRYYPNGDIADSGCGVHMPHHSGEADEEAVLDD